MSKMGREMSQIIDRLVKNVRDDNCRGHPFLSCHNCPFLIKGICDLRGVDSTREMSRRKLIELLGESKAQELLFDRLL